MPFEVNDPDAMFKILMLGAMNYLMAAFALGPEQQQEFKTYYVNDWLPRQRKLIDKLNQTK